MPFYVAEDRTRVVGELVEVIAAENSLGVAMPAQVECDDTTMSLEEVRDRRPHLSGARKPVKEYDRISVPSDYEMNPRSIS